MSESLESQTPAAEQKQATTDLSTSIVHKTPTHFSELQVVAQTPLAPNLKMNADATTPARPSGSSSPKEGVKNGFIGENETATRIPMPRRNSAPNVTNEKIEDDAECGNIQPTSSGGRGKLLRKRTSSMASLSEEESCQNRGSPIGKKGITVTDLSLPIKLLKAEERKKKVQETVESKVNNVFVAHSQGDEVEEKETKNTTPEKVDELVSDDEICHVGDEDGVEEFDPTAEVEKFDSKNELVDKWDRIQEEMQPELLRWAESTMENAFETVYTALHLFHLLNTNAQKKLRDGVEGIEAEEANQEDARQRIIAFQKEMERVTASLTAFASFGPRP